jgi:hypothetical protein
MATAQTFTNAPRYNVDSAITACALLLLYQSCTLPMLIPHLLTGKHAFENPGISHLHHLWQNTFSSSQEHIVVTSPLPDSPNGIGRIANHL